MKKFWRGCKKVALFPFKVIWWLLKNLGKIIAEILEAIFEFFTGFDI